MTIQAVVAGVVAYLVLVAAFAKSAGLLQCERCGRALVPWHAFCVDCRRDS